jgi:hypothetical protein
MDSYEEYSLINNNVSNNREVQTATFCIEEPENIPSGPQYDINAPIQKVVFSNRKLIERDT